MTPARTLSPFASLLVATDFSRGARVALDRALLLPLGASATLRLVHVLPRGRSDAEPQARKRLEELASAARRQQPGVEVSWELRRGPPFVELVRAAREAGAELTVLGAHGERAIKDLLVGSTADRVIRSGEGPALVVKGAARETYRRPVVGVDCGPVSSRALTLAARLVGPGTKRLEVVYAFHVPFAHFTAGPQASRADADYRSFFRKEAGETLHRFLVRHPALAGRTRETVREGDPRWVLLDEADRLDADLVAVGTHGRSGVVHALLGSVAEWTLRTASSDVLVARGKAKFELP